MPATIQFEIIKAHRGDQKWAFEEMCHLLFAAEHRARGEAVRREGAGGDGGLEGYIHDGAGRVVLGEQAKYFIGNVFVPDWWRQMTKSVHTALEANAHHGAMDSYTICTPRTFTTAQRKRWDELCREWMGYALTLGYTQAPEFVHWGFSELEERLLRAENRGHLLYWFDYPHFDAARCAKLNETTIAGLNERFMPGLHTPTFCEEKIHRFLRTEWAWQEFAKDTRRLVGPVLDGSWPEEQPLPRQLNLVESRFNSARQALKALFGDGCHWPVSVRELRDAASELSGHALDLEKAYREYLQRKATKPKAGDTGKVGSDVWHKCREALGETPNIGGWAHMFDDYQLFPDAQFLLVLGAAGNGKTHTLAEIVTGLEIAGGRALFVEGRSFTSSDAPWIQFLGLADFRGGVRDFLACFSALASTTAARAGGVTPPGLICVDALNETGDRSVWLHHLDKFAAELRTFPNLKLIVSCRTDFADLTVPIAIREATAEGWRVAEHNGLGSAVFDAAPRYLAEYKVRGADVLALAGEMENPLFLKTFCEAFKDREVPPGARSLPEILRACIARKAENIRDRIGCAISQTTDALRELARTMHDARLHPIPERDVRALLVKYHTATDDAHSLYRALCSEGFLHELRERDVLGERITVRFAYERVWDYLLTLNLLPPCEAPAVELRGLLADKDWCRSNQNLLSLLAIRLPEEGHGELHDFAALAPGTVRAVDGAFLESIRWRTQQSFTARTEALWRALSDPRIVPALFRLALAPIVAHPWNADALHAQLVAVPLGERDRSWSMALNKDFAGNDRDGIASRVLALAESPMHQAATDEQIRLLGTALGWICSTTAVAARHRAARALARLVRSRPAVAIALVERFKIVDDPQVFEAVLYAAAACAAHSTPSAPGLDKLARAVHAAIFAGATVQPHILIRHYAQIVCEETLSKGALPAGIAPESFHPPFKSVWPQIMSEAEESALEAEYKRDYTTNRALGALLTSTRTEQMGGYGDWGRYDMGSVVHHFQHALLTDAPEPEGVRSGFDDRIARRYILGRVLALGLNKASDDKPPGKGYKGRSRPSIERLGKKYQWIAFHEFLGYLTDHYHYCDYVYAAAESFRSAIEIGLPDMLDPVLTETPAKSSRDEWSFVESLPWWIPLSTPYPHVLGKTERHRVVAAVETANPGPLLRPGGVQGAWLTLAGFWNWDEPLPCWVDNGAYSLGHAALQWHARSYAVPAGKLAAFTRKMRGPIVGRGMIENLPTLREEMNALVSYPTKATAFDSECATTFSKVPGAWFAAAEYSTRTEGSDAKGGVIPSPQLASLAGLTWTRYGLDFSTGTQTQAEFHSLKADRHAVTLMDAKLLTRLFESSGLRLVWRLYGWKWCHTMSSEHSPSREYWALYVLGEDGLPNCIGGGTWTPQPNAVEEPLPWLSV